MADDIMGKTADWEPGTLEHTRKNIGLIDQKEAQAMAKKLGGQNLYERTSSQNSSSSNSNPNKNSGRIMRDVSPQPKPVQKAPTITPKKHIREQLPQISKKMNNVVDKLMMSSEYKIKQNYGIFNFIRTLQKNGTEKVLPEFTQYSVSAAIDHMESFITVIKTLIQIAPATYKSKIVNGSESKFKFLRMVASWGMVGIKTEYATLRTVQDQILVCDLVNLVKAIYKPIISVYYYGTNKIPKLIKEVYNDEIQYPEAPKDKLSTLAKKAITEWLYIDTEIIKKFYPLLLRMCSDSYEDYPNFFTTNVADILKFTNLHKFDLLLPDKPKEEKQETKQKNPPPQKGVKDSTVTTGLKILNQLFPQAGFDKLDEHPDLYPYFQPLYKFADGFNSLSPENPLQVTMVLHRIIEDCFQGCRNIGFARTDYQKQGSDSIQEILEEWAQYREDSFERLYCEPLVDLTNSVYSQPDFEKSHIGKKTLTSLLWQTSYHFLPSFKFEKLLLERPADESKYRPLFHRTDFARKFLTLVVNECDSKAKTKGTVSFVDNPWEHYKFEIQTEVSKRLDVLLGAQNKSANTNATNANLIKYTLCIIAVLDWWINNPESPAYSTDPMSIYRVSPEDGKPQFSVEERTDQNKLFVDTIKANYQRQAQ